VKICEERQKSWVMGSVGIYAAPDRRYNHHGSGAKPLEEGRPRTGQVIELPRVSRYPIGLWETDALRRCVSNEQCRDTRTEDAQIAKNAKLMAVVGKQLDSETRLSSLLLQSGIGINFPTAFNVTTQNKAISSRLDSVPE
jgi:hypothetical protein